MIKSIFTASAMTIALSASAFAAGTVVKAPAATAQAQTPITTRPNYHQGYYMQGGVGTYAGFVDYSTDMRYTGAHGGVGGLFAAGYQTGPHFGIEMDALYGHFSVNDKEIGGNDSVSANGLLVGPAIKGIATLGNHFYLTGRLGVGYLGIWENDNIKTGTPIDNHDKVSGSLVVPFDGIGMGYAVTNHLDINLNYTGELLLIANAGLVSAGVTYHF